MVFYVELKAFAITQFTLAPRSEQPDSTTIATVITNHINSSKFVSRPGKTAKGKFQIGHSDNPSGTIGFI